MRANNKLSVLKTPDRGQKRPPDLGRTSRSQHPRSSTAAAPDRLSTATAVSSPAPAQDPSRATAVSSPVPVPISVTDTVPARAASPVLALAPLFHAHAKPKSNDRGKSISMVLLDLSNKGMLR